MYLAKYLGMFNYTHTHKQAPYCDPGDMYMHKYTSANNSCDPKSPNNSFYHHHYQGKLGTQKDGINCGMLVIMSMLNLLFPTCDGQYLPLQDEDMNQDTLTFTRCKIYCFLTKLREAVCDESQLPYCYQSYCGNKKTTEPVQ